MVVPRLNKGEVTLTSTLRLVVPLCARPCAPLMLLRSGAFRCVDAFTVALNQACEGGKNRWYTSSLELQLASLELCRACRKVPTLRVLVDDRTPRTLWSPRKTHNADADTRSSKASRTSRVPVVRVLGVTWGRFSAEDLMQRAAIEQWEGSVEMLSFGDNFDESIAGVVWPASLQQISFGDEFDQPIAGVVWPSSLQHLSFEYFSTRPSLELCGSLPAGTVVRRQVRPAHRLSCVAGMSSETLVREGVRPVH